MYAPSRTPTFAAEPGGSAPVTVAGDRENFRPVALPALAAAVHVSSAAVKAARAKAEVGTRVRVVHEDEPVD
ncbi:hypothetical protein PUR23_25115 [Methylorubrum populi]|jgi:hypothetical protein|uniref:Uncharacterized protein n=1 Tax=Methylorubrum thiocyanatum TaxID=47958 RepID=A0AA40S218_9HYPH|nr:hypothetical protein [Methylorubrum thiocyanatum]MBA8912727.1 hypothetical protein [Methylorubrum thiocyanatum]GJE80119.1 hypothetical protein CJNNKLLH_1450 [Methylorubrum thiocyanatum]